MVTESYRDYSRKHIRKEFASLDNFLNQWNHCKKKEAIIDELEEYGIELPKLAQEVGKDFGDFDLFFHINCVVIMLGSEQASLFTSE